VQLTIKIKLMTTQAMDQVLLDLLRRINAASTYTALIAKSTGTFNGYKLRALVYNDLKTNYLLGASMAGTAALRAAKAYANKKQRGRTVRFDKKSAIPLDRNTFTYKKNNIVSIWTPAGRLKIPFHCYKEVPLSSKIEAKLVLQDGVFYIHQPVEVEVQEQLAPTEYLGVDLGIKNIAVTSDGTVYSGALLNSLRRRNLRLRRKLQKKQTKSAKRLLKKRSKKEARFANDVNHCISKKIVQKAKDTLQGIAIEDLKNIRKRLGRKPKGGKQKQPKQCITVSKPQRTALSSWSFFQLRSYIEYKALVAGIPVVTVFPHYTSQRCSACGYIHKANRKTRDVFICNQCGYTACADYNAACNISYVASGGVRLSPVRGGL